jgi:hypothetical protein
VADGEQLLTEPEPLHAPHHGFQRLAVEHNSRNSSSSDVADNEQLSTEPRPLHAPHRGCQQEALEQQQQHQQQNKIWQKVSCSDVCGA